MSEESVAERRKSSGNFRRWFFYNNIFFFYLIFFDHRKKSLRHFCKLVCSHSTLFCAINVKKSSWQIFELARAMCSRYDYLIGWICCLTLNWYSYRLIHWRRWMNKCTIFPTTKTGNSHTRIWNSKRSSEVEPSAKYIKHGPMVLGCSTLETRVLMQKNREENWLGLAQKWS